MSLFKKNLSAVRSHDTDLAERLSGLKPTERIKRTRENDRAVLLKITGPDGAGRIKFPAIKRPALDSEANALAEARMVVVLGFGSGDYLAEVVNRTSDQTFVLLIDPDVDLFCAVLRETDLSNVLKLDRVSLAIGETARAATFIRAEMEYGAFTLTDFVVIRNQWSAPIYKTYFEQVEQSLGDLAAFGKTNLATLASMAELWRENILANLAAMLKSRCVSSLFNKFKGVAAVIVAAGPSLDKTAYHLTAFKNHGLIIAVDTAVRTLLHVGVEPDIVVSLDAQEANYLHLKGIELPDTLMVLNPIAHPEIVRTSVSPMVFSDYSDPMFKWLERTIGERGTIRTGGSVSTSAFDLAVKMGCSPVILVGQDMAYSNNATHSKNSIQQMARMADCPLTLNGAAGNLYDLALDDTFTSEDIFGAQVTTTYKMASWKVWYEFITGHENIYAVNATEGGIKIDGIETVTIKEAVEKARANGGAPDFDLLVSSSAPSAPTHSVVTALTDARDEARLVKNICAEGIRLTRSALSLMTATPSEDFDLSKALRRISKLSREIMDKKIFTETNRWSVDITLDKVENLQRFDFESDDDPMSLEKTAKAFLLLFTEIYDVAKNFERSINNAVKTLTVAKA